MTLFRRSWAVATVMGALLAPMWGCGGARAKHPGQDPARQSDAEYRLATDLWVRQNQPRTALRHALEALDLNYGNADAAHLVSLIYLDFCRRDSDECRLDTAEEYARRAVKRKRDYREARNTLGVVLIHAGKLDEAIEVLKPLTQDMLYQTPENAWGNLGWAYLKKGQVKPAIDALSRSVAAQPLFCVGHYRLGLAFEKAGHVDAAIEAFGSALDADDQRCKGLQLGYLGRARVLLRAGRGEEARQDLDSCVALDDATRAGQECAALTRKLQ